MSSTRRPARIVVLLENNPYHADVRVRPHTQALAEAGHAVTVLSPRRKGGRDNKWRENKDGIRHYRFPNPANGTGTLNYVVEFVYATAVLSVLTLWVWLRHGCDILLFYNPPDSLFVPALLPKLAGKQIIYDLRDLGPELYRSKFEKPNPLIDSALLWMERRAARLADYITTVNDSYRRLISERNGVPLDRITVVRQGPDLKRVHTAPVDGELRRRAETIFGYIGYMAKQDGIDHLFEALHHLDNDIGYRDWYCVLIGTAEHPAMLKRMAERFGIADRVRFTGYMQAEQWVPLLSTADICVEPCPANPLNKISTMNKIMDYMALSKPTVAYDLDEHRVTAGPTALYAEPDNALDMARQFARLIEEPELRKQMGTAGRQRVEQELAWCHQKQRLLALYDKITVNTATNNHSRQTG